MDICEADLLAHAQNSMTDDCLISDDIGTAWAANLAELAALIAARTTTTTAPSMITTFFGRWVGYDHLHGGSFCSS